MKKNIGFFSAGFSISSDQSAGNGEGGFVLITVMLVMVLLMVLALTTADTSILNTRIENNKRQYTVHFHTAEAANMEATQLLSAETDPARLNPRLKIDPLPDPVCTSSSCPKIPAPLVVVEQENTNAKIDPDDVYYSENPLATQYDLNRALWNPAQGDQTLQPRRAEVGADEPSMSVRQVVVFQGTPLGESLVDGEKMYQYAVYGRAAKTAGEDSAVAVVTGYRRKMSDTGGTESRMRETKSMSIYW